MGRALFDHYFKKTGHILAQVHVCVAVGSRLPLPLGWTLLVLIIFWNDYVNCTEDILSQDIAVPGSEFENFLGRESQINRMIVFVRGHVSKCGILLKRPVAAL